MLVIKKHKRVLMPLFMTKVLLVTTLNASAMGLTTLLLQVDTTKQYIDKAWDISPDKVYGALIVSLIGFIATLLYITRVLYTQGREDKKEFAAATSGMAAAITKFTESQNSLVKALDRNTGIMEENNRTLIKLQERVNHNKGRHGQG